MPTGLVYVTRYTSPGVVGDAPMASGLIEAGESVDVCHEAPPSVE